MPARFTRWVLGVGFLLASFAFAPAAQAQAKGSYQFLQMTTIESIVPGGMGRSRVMFTPEWKGTKESTMENLFSLTGINLGNVHSNEELIVRYLNEITADGWELYQTTPLTQTIQGTGGQSQQGIFLTRYLFRKAK
ncbi:hypothetical protein [Hymenobacter properus]|uniref:DUF4177 domain-containing protein n=1 Tax=Hymenobacter properus TaxID=2791026 RepID=A0A931BGI4_9BACT|nr:hypothetical protein [Hymenobacter properus]MBF9141221.1 hypothetical protein [Hymenobacter properus]MBR7720030.1 hypothetical protein [Microvirga sp. SRT04]